MNDFLVYLYALHRKYRLPDYLTVHISGEDTEDGQPKNIIVEIENAAIVKPFLCGYKDKISGKLFLDAFTQTGPYFDKWKYRRYRSRDTQTWEHKEKTLVSGRWAMINKSSVLNLNLIILEYST